MARKDSGICIYCQEAKAATRDHVPPKSIFPEPRPNNLVTVPACGICNREASKDDEYFRAYLAVRIDADDAPKIELITAATNRALERSKGFFLGWIESMRIIEREDAEGFVEKVLQFPPNNERLNRVIERTIRGLHFHHTDKMIPTDFHFLIMADHGFNNLTGDDPFSAHIQRLQDKENRNVIEEDVFEYYFTEDEGYENSIEWVLTFFIHARFLVFVSPEKLLEKYSSQESE